MEGYFAMQFVFCVDIDVANRTAEFFVAIKITQGRPHIFSDGNFETHMLTYM